jgi:AraC-like DNA-binding protein
MEVAIRTLDKLRSLEQLYRQGFRSEVIDRTLDKLLAAEAERVLAERRDLEARLSAYEKQFNMSSQEFYRRFRAGELGDEMDFVEWSVFYEMYQVTRQRLDMLGADR